MALMEKLSSKFRKGVLCSVLMVFGVFVGFEEVIFLAGSKTVNVLGISDEVDQNNLTISQSENSNQIKLLKNKNKDDRNTKTGL